MNYDIPNLKYLNVSNNKIMSVFVNILCNYENLKEIDVSNN